MRIGYVGMNTAVGCVSTKTFRLASYSEARLLETVENNLVCLREILEFNVRHGIRYFRITSGLVPFASHGVNLFDWQGHFRQRFKEVGGYVREHGLRLTFHPDQFTLINSLDGVIFEKSVRELEYQVSVLDLMGQGPEAKVQIHVGGAYGDKGKSLSRFVERYKTLSEGIRRRLVVENDDRIFNVLDCLSLSRETGIPVVFDNLHHRLNNDGMAEREAMEKCFGTWKEMDGLPSVDYAEQQPGGRAGAHAEIVSEKFRDFLMDSAGLDYDVILETKGREKSALRAVELALEDKRFL